MVYASMVINSIIGALLAISGLAKVRRHNIVDVIEDYRVLPLFLASRLAIALPFIEAGLGLLLILGFLSMATLIAGAALFLAFSVGILINLLRGREIDCGCRSKPRPISWSLLATDSVLAGLCVWGALVSAPGIVQTLIGGSDMAASQGWAAVCTLALLAVVAKGIELDRELRHELQTTPATFARTTA